MARRSDGPAVIEVLRMNLNQVEQAIARKDSVTAKRCIDAAEEMFKGLQDGQGQAELAAQPVRRCVLRGKAWWIGGGLSGHDTFDMGVGLVAVASSGPASACAQACALDHAHWKL